MPVSATVSCKTVKNLEVEGLITSDQAGELSAVVASIVATEVPHDAPFLRTPKRLSRRDQPREHAAYDPRVAEVTP